MNIKSMKYIVFMLLISFFQINIVNAKMCDNEDMQKMKGIAGGITYETKYLGDFELLSDLQMYEVRFNLGELDGKVYISESDDEDSLRITHSNEPLRVQSGKRTLYVYYTNCGEKEVGSIRLNLNIFNEYFLLDSCLNLEDTLAVCKQWVDKPISQSEFDFQMNEYLSSQFKMEEKSISNYISRYYIYIILGGIVLVILFIFLIIRHIKNNRLD